MSLPYEHIIQDRLKKNGMLQPQYLDTKWRLDRLATLPPINISSLLRDPIKIRARGKENGQKIPRQGYTGRVR
jgi:hypothetical protein